MLAAKREEKHRGTEKETSLLLNYKIPPIRRRDEPMKNQNRENEKKDSDETKKKQQAERK